MPTGSEIVPCLLGTVLILHKPRTRKSNCALTPIVSCKQSCLTEVLLIIIVLDTHVRLIYCGPITEQSIFPFEGILCRIVPCLLGTVLILHKNQNQEV